MKNIYVARIKKKHGKLSIKFSKPDYTSMVVKIRGMKRVITRVTTSREMYNWILTNPKNRVVWLQRTEKNDEIQYEQRFSGKSLSMAMVKTKDSDLPEKCLFQFHAELLHR